MEDEKPSQETITEQPLGYGVPAQIFYVRNAPPGLECLLEVDKLVVKQEVELLEILTGYDTLNKYIIQDDQGKELFKAEEESTFCGRHCCGNNRAFDVHINGANGEAIRLSRKLKCDSCCCPCCLQKLYIFAPAGQLIGSVEQQWSIKPKLFIKDGEGNVRLVIRGPFCTSSCCCCCGGKVDFQIFSPDGEKEIGVISKLEQDFILEKFSNADNFSVTFPIDLEVRLKAVILGALVLIDFIYFERPKHRTQNIKG